ncbi:MAG: hypothetical protein H6577_23955 [Lewinellaceae bacterium]|nr:hypothetical protein [Saprospiraceae bacterium]MCB9341189.1 hypothetical protein [Lewinellaceae bacterium]
MNYKYLAKNGPTFALLASLVFILIAVIPILMGLSAFDSLPDNNQRAFSEEGNIFRPGLVLSVALLVVAVALAILLSLFKVLTNPKNAMKGLISFAVMAVLFIIFYSISDAGMEGPLAATIQRFNVSETISKVISAGISLTLLLTVGSIAIIVILEVWNYFKNQ